MFVKTKITSNARKGKIQQNEYNEWGHWAAESSCFKTFWAVSPQRSSVNSTLPVSSRCTMGSGNVDILSSLSPWCSCDTLLLISSLDVPSTTNLKLFCQHLLFCWLVVKFLCWSVQCFPLLFISVLAELSARGCLLYLDLYSELKDLVLRITKLQCRIDVVWDVKNFWERNGPAYTFLWVLKGPFRHTIVFTFPAALSWELDLYKLQKIYVLLHAVACSVFLQCVKTAAKMKKYSMKVILTIYILHMRVD